MRKLDPNIIVSNLTAMFPEITSIRRYGDTQVHLGNAAEGGMIKELPAADYYGEFTGGYPYIHPDLKEAVEGMGYHIEWYDPGTLIAYQD